MSKNEELYKESQVLEAFEGAINDIWQQGDTSFFRGVSRKTNKKKFLEKLRKIKLNNNGRTNTN